MTPPPTIAATVRAVLTGKAVAYTRPGSRSAIAKTVRPEPVYCHATGLEGDEQGDPRVHGGPDKTVHLYPLDNYEWWRGQLGGHPRLEAPGAFGENLTVEGLTEAEVCLGDRFRIGGAVLEVSQGRQPCWKLNDHFGVPAMAKLMQESRRTGWYCRVLDAGWIRAGDALVLEQRPLPEWNLDRLMRLIFDRNAPWDEVRAGLELPLPESWERLLRGRLERPSEEESAPRLEGPPAG
ncbi:MAG: MOSC domain-containing protein [Puniceicoccaceae bacterium]|nr:MAG: MOSC domain-containing protein [Puniceicoccaceae bacterium]